MSINVERILNSIYKGGRPYILLADHNEKHYSTKAMNWEQFTLTSVIHSNDATMLCNTRGHHVSDQCHTSFIYLLSHNIWITQNVYSRETNIHLHVFGGMNVYSEHQLKFKDNCIYKKNIFNIQALKGNEIKSLIDFIKDGCTFYLACELENGVSLSLLIDLPMINESGEYQMKIKPFVGFPGAIFHPEEFSKKMNALTESADKSLTSIGCPSIFDSPDNISKGITQEVRKLPCLPVNFDQTAFNLYCRPSTINIVIKDSNQLFEIASQTIPYSNDKLFIESIKIVKCILQVCE